MQKFQVFDPPMCCSTGVCGPEVDPTLVRFAADLEWLKTNGIEVERFNLSQDPGAFVGNPVVADAIRGRDDALPLLLVDGRIAAQGSYPGREVLAELAGVAVPAKYLGTKADGKQTQSTCCPPSGGGPVALSKPGASAKKCC